MWSAQTKVELIGHNDRQYIWRKKKMRETCIISSVKYGGGSIMWWGGFAADAECKTKV